MSTDVHIYVNRKSDGQPSGRYYLGGNGTKNELSTFFQNASDTIVGFGVMKMANARLVGEFIEKHKTDFYSDNMTDVLEEDFLNRSSPDDFTYWLVFEY